MEIPMAITLHFLTADDVGNPGRFTEMKKVFQVASMARVAHETFS